VTPEAQRIAIAEACGWKKSGYWAWSGQDCYERDGNEPCAASRLPNYLTDLNAMHEAEKTLPDFAGDDESADQLGFCETLAEVVGAKWNTANSYDMWLIVNATAAQRAEAFLRTIGKWQPTP
jgi:hypothetical protein